MANTEAIITQIYDFSSTFSMSQEEASALLMYHLKPTNTSTPFSIRRSDIKPAPNNVKPQNPRVNKGWDDSSQTGMLLSWAVYSKAREAMLYDKIVEWNTERKLFLKQNSLLPYANIQLIDFDTKFRKVCSRGDYALKLALLIQITLAGKMTPPASWTTKVGELITNSTEIEADLGQDLTFNQMQVLEEAYQNRVDILKPFTGVQKKKACKAAKLTLPQFNHWLQLRQNINNAPIPQDWFAGYEMHLATADSTPNQDQMTKAKTPADPCSILDIPPLTFEDIYSFTE